MKKIILITCYFGKFPWYFPFFLKSCGYNPTVDFIIYSDCKLAFEIPGNVKIISFSLDKFNRLASRKLGFDISVKTPYKLCDFKPAYGAIFQDSISHYEFWGITDIDVVFGRIREFMSEELLERYDVISVRNDYPTGCFMLFKNTKKINLLFTKSKDYKKVFTSDIHYCFDECNFKHGFLQNGGDIFEIECEIESMHHIIKREENNNNLKAHFDFLIIEGLPGQLKWEKGILTFKNEYEILLHHLIRYKSHHYTRKIYWENVPDTFYIDKHLIRKSSMNSLKKWLLFYFFEKIRPFFKEKIFQTDYRISKTLSWNLKGIPKNNYILNGTVIGLSKDYKNNYTISYNATEPRKIFKAVLSKDSFFVESSTGVRYKLIEGIQGWFSLLSRAIIIFMINI